MERQRKTCDRDRKRKRESARDKLELLENKLQQQEEISEQLKETIQGIFFRLNTIQDLLIGKSSLERSSCIRPISEPSPQLKRVINKRKIDEDDICKTVDGENTVCEIGSPIEWKSGKHDVIDIFRSQIQRPTTYRPWSGGENHTPFGSSVHSVVTNNAMASYLHSQSSLAPHAFHFGGMGGGSGGGGGGRGGNTNRAVTAAPFNTTEPEIISCAGGRSAEGTASSNPLRGTDSPCDCIQARQFCKCLKQGGASTIAPGTSTGGPQLTAQPVSPSLLTATNSSRNNETKLFADKEKDACICKGSGKVWRVCPLKAKRKQSSGGKDYSPAEPQHFTEKDLENVFDSKSEPEVQLGPNEQLFMDIFPQLNKDLRHHKVWPLPFTPMQDYSGLPNVRFAEPFKFTDKELEKAFDEEEIHDVQIQDTECVFMDQFPELTTPTSIPRGHRHGQGPMVDVCVCRTPGPSAGTIRSGANTSKKCPSVVLALNGQKSSTQPISTIVPPVLATGDSRSQAGTGMSRKADKAGSETSGKSCASEILDECDCAPCRITHMGAGKNMSGDFITPKSPQSHLSSRQGEGSSMHQQQSLRTPVSNSSCKGQNPITVGDTASHCSCFPCPSRDGDRGIPPVSALHSAEIKVPSAISSQPPITPQRQVMTQSVGTQAPGEICQEHPLEECHCKPTCSEHKLLLRIRGTAKSAVQGSSSTQLYIPSFGDPQKWSDKELEHAFSEEEIHDVELSPNEAVFMQQFPKLANIKTFMRTPQPLPYTPLQDFSHVPTECFVYPQEFSEKELDAAFEEEEVPNVVLGDNERNFMREFPALSGFKGPRPGQGVDQLTCGSKRVGSSRLCKCKKRIIRACKCKEKAKEKKNAVKNN